MNLWAADRKYQNKTSFLDIYFSFCLWLFSQAASWEKRSTLQIKSDNIWQKKQKTFRSGELQFMISDSLGKEKNQRTRLLIAIIHHSLIIENFSKI